MNLDYTLLAHPEPKDLDARGRAYAGYLERQGNGGLGEGKVHRLLKGYIAAHPEEIGLNSISPSRNRISLYLR